MTGVLNECVRVCICVVNIVSSLVVASFVSHIKERSKVSCARNTYLIALHYVMLRSGLQTIDSK